MRDTIRKILQGAIQKERKRMETAQSNIGWKLDMEKEAFRPVVDAARLLERELRGHGDLITLEISDRFLDVKLGRRGDRRYGHITITTNGKSYLVKYQTYIWMDDCTEEKITLHSADETTEYLVTECGKFIAHREKYGRN